VARIIQVTTRARVTTDMPTTHAVSMTRLYKSPSIITFRAIVMYVYTEICIHIPPVMFTDREICDTFLLMPR
jgi:hypothetical protein